MNVCEVGIIIAAGPVLQMLGCKSSELSSELSSRISMLEVSFRYLNILYVYD